MINTYKQCRRCILNGNDSKGISFDDSGLCNNCQQFDEKWQHIPKNQHESDLLIKPVIKRVKQDGEGRKYDCIIGVSGGVDSTYIAMLVKEMGLRPLAVHFDNGWNSELAVKNIEKIVSKLEIDLFTYVINWEDFKRLQLAYLRASVVDIEALTDHAIFGAIYKIAYEHDIKYIFSGSNVATEGFLPGDWVHNKNDFMNIKSIFKRYGNGKVSTYPFVDKSMRKKIAKYNIEVVSILDMIPFNIEQAKIDIHEKLDWTSYEGKHFESIFTRFYQGYILPRKFGIDKRKAHLSNLICSGQMTREQALQEMNKVIYSESQIQEDLEFVTKKLGLSISEFEEIMALPVRSHSDFDVEGSFFSHYPIFKPLRPLWRKYKKSLDEKSPLV